MSFLLQNNVRKSIHVFTAKKQEKNTQIFSV